MEPTKENFHDLCNQLKSMLKNTTNPIKRETILGNNMIKKLFDLMNSQKITGKQKVRRKDIVDENSRTESFLALFKQIHETKNQKLINQVIETGICDQIVESFDHKIVFVGKQAKSEHIAKRGKYIDLYIEMLIDSLLRNNTIETIIEIYLASHKNKNKHKKIFINKYGVFLDMIISIRNFIHKSPQIMCQKYWETNLINVLKQIYCSVWPDDVCTKNNCFAVIEIFIGNNYYDHRIIEFLINILCMKEAGSIADHDDRHNYSGLISDVCDTVNELLIKYHDSEITKLLITSIQNSYIIENLKCMIEHKFNFVEPTSMTDGPKKLLDTIKKLKIVIDSDSDYSLNE